MNKQIYYRLIALWVLCEAMLGGIIHGLKIPVSGLFVGSCAVICICLIAWYVPQRGAIIKATIIVAIFKMMLSPQAPPPAYIAVLFQGILGEVLFFRHRKFYFFSCILLAILALLESGLQRILVLTLVYGNDLWKVINDFINGLTKQKVATNYSLLIGTVYVLLHLATGIIVGWWAALLPKRIERWQQTDKYNISIKETDIIAFPAAIKKRNRLKKGLFVVWIILMVVYVQSYFNIGEPLLPPYIAFKILIRSIIIVFSWLFIVSPLLKQILHRWLQKEKTRSQQEIKEVLQLLPATQQLIRQSWKKASILKGSKRLSHCFKIILVNAVNNNEDYVAGKTERKEENDSPSVLSPSRQKIYILTAPIQSGKTTSLLNWSADRKDVYGILTPIVNGKRVFMNAHTKEQFPMEAEEEETAILTVGRFAFSKSNFEKAIQVIREAIPANGWLVIDEIGPLEIRGEGFYSVLKEVTDSNRNQVLLVVRDKDNTLEKIKNMIGQPDFSIHTDLTASDFLKK